jgi:two-component system, sensor histidine kinase and response regulator
MQLQFIPEKFLSYSHCFFIIKAGIPEKNLRMTFFAGTLECCLREKRFEMEPFCYGKEDISILCVEDDPDARNILRETIKNRFPDITLHVAENGIIGLDMFKEHAPHLTITDIRMPLMDGIRMAEEIRVLEPDARILVLTAHDDTSYLLDAIRIGISNYLLKPFDPNMFYETVNESIREIVLQREAREESKVVMKLPGSDVNSSATTMFGEEITNCNNGRPAFNGLDGFDSAEGAMLSPAILKAMGSENKDFEAFCFRLAHDLRSPLNGINITCEALVMLFGDQFNDECKTFLGHIQEEVQRMNKMIDGVMTFPERS